MERKISDKDINNLKKYVTLLLKWNKSINLIAQSTEKEAWDRHILDSLQLLDYIKLTNINIVDLGSGAGMPALIMAIVDCANNYTLVEANLKKCTFLNEVIRQLALSNVSVVNARIEDYIKQNIKANIVTARGLTSLVNLVKYLESLLLNNGFALFPKGENYAEELLIAKESFDSKYFFEAYDSKTNSNSKIIKVSLLN